MIGQYLPQTNESATVPENPKFLPTKQGLVSWDWKVLVSYQMFYKILERVFGY